MEILTAFIIGLLGSMHCIGMCGPLVLALPAGKFGSFRFYTGRFIYNSGRVITYTFFGLIFGIIGKNLAMAGIQRWVSIASGIIIIIMVLVPKSSKLLEISFFSKLTLKIKKLFIDNFSKGTYPSMLFLGIINGLLPCGFVYVGLAGALASGDVYMGMLYMALFGAGTIPLMFATSVAGNLINLNVKQKLSKALPAFAILLAVIFILRGMNLGIPYISPKTEKMINTLSPAKPENNTNTKDCCK